MKSVSRVIGLLGLLTSASLARSQAAPGPYPKEAAQWTEADKTRQREAGKAILEHIDSAVRTGQKEIKIPKGDYRFENKISGVWTHIHWKNIENLTIDFQGSNLWMEKQASAVVMSGCRNVTIKNAFIDWDPLPFTQGTIVAVDPSSRTLEVRLDEGYQRVTEGMTSVPENKNAGWRGVLFDATTRELKAEQPGFTVTAFWNDKLPNGNYKVGVGIFYDRPFAELTAKPGDKIVMLKREGRGFRIEGCEGIVLEDVTMYASPFVCFAEAHGKGGTLYRRVNIVRRPGTNRLFSSNADGINSSNCELGPIIENCRIEYLGDDFVNIHGHFGRVLKQESPTVIVVSKLHYRGGLPTPLPVEIFQRKGMHPVAAVQIEKAEYVSNWNIPVEPEKTLADLSQKWNSGEASKLAYGATVPAMRLTLDQSVTIPPDSILISERFVGSGGVIRNCDFKGSIARGIRLQSPHALIEDNRISWTAGAAITMTSQPEYWGEGTNVHHAIVRKNIISDSGMMTTRGERGAIAIVSPGDYRTKDARLEHHIEIVDNEIVRPGGPAVVARGVADLIISRNTIRQANTLPTFHPAWQDMKLPPGAGYSIIAEYVTGLKTSDNQFLEPGPLNKGEVIILPSTGSTPDR